MKLLYINYIIDAVLVINVEFYYQYLAGVYDAAYY